VCNFPDRCLTIHLDTRIQTIKQLLSTKESFQREWQNPTLLLITGSFCQSLGTYFLVALELRAWDPCPLLDLL